ncbi:hypothetical protein BKA59DRAFT_388449, partial [Fusarium tricinctum]
REMAMCWCKTSIGRATFKILIWEWMISYRIDDISITLFKLPGDTANEVELADWKKMSEFLGSTRKANQVRALFYPLASSSAIAKSTRRRIGFLTAIDNRRY